MKKLGLIGYPLGHSFSVAYFASKFKSEGIKGYSYESFELETIEQLDELINRENPIGLNVTIPYKQEVLPYLNELHGAAATLRTVNTIKLIDGKLHGYNTDVIGFRDSLKPLLKSTDTTALILGTGGASNAVAYVLDELNISYLKVSRTGGDLTYSDLNQQRLDATDLIVNTTPVGTYPNVDSCPLPKNLTFRSGQLVYDLVYNPEKTVLLARAEQAEARFKNGYEMLVGQAEASWKIWNDL